MCWSFQLHLSAFIPFHPIVLIYWNYFRLFGCNAVSLFLLGLLEYCLSNFENTGSLVPPFYTITSCLVQVLCSIFSTPETLCGPLKSGLGSLSMCSYSAAYLSSPCKDLDSYLCYPFFLCEDRDCIYSLPALCVVALLQDGHHQVFPPRVCTPHPHREAESLPSLPWIWVGLTDSL